MGRAEHRAAVLMLLRHHGGMRPMQSVPLHEAPPIFSEACAPLPWYRRIWTAAVAYWRYVRFLIME